MLQALKGEVLRAVWRKPVLALLEERMDAARASATAAPLRHGMASNSICKDGPCFDLREVY